MPVKNGLISFGTVAYSLRDTVCIRLDLIHSRFDVTVLSGFARHWFFISLTPPISRIHYPIGQQGRHPMEDKQPLSGVIFLQALKYFTDSS